MLVATSTHTGGCAKRVVYIVRITNWNYYLIHVHVRHGCFFFYSYGPIVPLRLRYLYFGKTENAKFISLQCMKGLCSNYAQIVCKIWQSSAYKLITIAVKFLVGYNFSMLKSYCILRNWRINQNMVHVEWQAFNEAMSYHFNTVDTYLALERIIYHASPFEEMHIYTDFIILFYINW